VRYRRRTIERVECLENSKEVDESVEAIGFGKSWEGEQNVVERTEWRTCAAISCTTCQVLMVDMEEGCRFPDMLARVEATGTCRVSTYLPSPRTIRAVC